MNRPTKSLGQPQQTAVITAPKRPSLNYRSYIFAVLLLLTTLLAYRPAWNGGPLLDDFDRLLTTTEQQSYEGLKALWFQPATSRQYHPVVDTVFWIGANLWRQNPLGYHLMSILLHVVAALLFVRLLQKLQIEGAWLAAAIFALHPVHVESVAWMVEIKNTLSGVFFLGCVLLYLRFLENRNWSTYGFLIVIFTLGVLSKAIVAAFPIVVLVLLWWKRGRITWKQTIRPLLPFVVLGAIAGALTAWMERAFSGAEGSDLEFSTIDRLLIAGRAFWFYLYKLFWPAELNLFYPRWEIRPDVWWQYLFPIATIALFLAAVRLRKQHRWLLAVLMIYFALIAPLLGFFNVNFFRYAFVADHFQYLPSLPLIAAAAAGSIALFSWLNTGQRFFAVVGYAVVLLLLASLTWSQSGTYRDAETVYRTIIARNPGSSLAHVHIGSELLRRNELDQAAAHFRKALELSGGSGLDSYGAWLGLGQISLQNGRYDEAIPQLQTALQLNPKSAAAHHSLGIALHRKGQLKEAVVQFEQALHFAPQSISIRVSLSWILATCSDSALRNGARAVELAQRADSLSAGANPRVLRSLAASYAETGQFAAAGTTARHALGLIRKKGETAVSGALQNEIALYDAGLPFHERPIVR